MKRLKMFWIRIEKEQECRDSRGIKIVTQDAIHLTTFVWSMGYQPGGGGTPLYGLYRYVRRQSVCFLAVLVCNRVSILTSFGLK